MRIPGRLASFLMIAVITLSFSAIALGQSDGTIFGTVKDATGAVVADASITVLNPAKGITRKATTNADGVFVYPQLPPGTYTIHAEKPGFKRVEKSNVVVATGDKAQRWRLHPRSRRTGGDRSGDGGRRSVADQVGVG